MDTIRVPSATSHEAGFTVPVELTRAAWDDCVTWTSTDTTCTGIPQDEDGRLWDVLWMARSYRATTRDRVEFQVHRWDRTGRPTPMDGFDDDGDEDPLPPLVSLLAVRRTTSDGAPIVTIMQPAEYTDPHAACGDNAWKQVTCDRCKRAYQCTPGDDYYCTPAGDHCCEPCLLTGLGVPVLTVIDPRNN